MNTNNVFLNQVIVRQVTNDPLPGGLEELSDVILNEKGTKQFKIYGSRGSTDRVCEIKFAASLPSPWKSELQDMWEGSGKTEQLRLYYRTNPSGAGITNIKLAKDPFDVSDDWDPLHNGANLNGAGDPIYGYCRYDGNTLLAKIKKIFLSLLWAKHGNNKRKIKLIPFFAFGTVVTVGVGILIKVLF